MNAGVKLNKQGIRDLNYYGPKVKKTADAEVATLVEGGAAAVLPSLPEPAVPTAAPDSPTS